MIGAGAGPSGTGEGADVTEGRAVEELVVGILGGTGPQGRGLAVRLAELQPDEREVLRQAVRILDKVNHA